MLQEVPNLTPAEIRQGLISGATPMNGTAAGSWNQQSGYGLVNAINAINAVDLLRVVSTNPANGSTVTVSPSAITVTFNKAGQFLDGLAADLTFTSVPAGVTVILGTPIAVDNPTDPTIIQFPFSFSRSASASTANGSYTFSIQSPTSKPVESEDGKNLVASGPITFTLADTTSPTITSTSVSGRTVSITFSKAVDPATVTGSEGLANIFVVRQGSQTAWPPTPATLANYTNLNSYAGVTISYNPATFTVTLNYSQLPQTEMPTDKYAIVVLSPTTSTSSGVTDLVGNPLFGLYNGGFPTGVGETTPQDFIQNLGLETVVAPIITTLVMTPTASNDTGIIGDQNTNITDPTFIGQVYAPFPGTVAGLQVFLEFANNTNQGVLTLGVGGGGRGTNNGPVSQTVFTDVNGAFTVQATGLLQGFQSVVAVVEGEDDDPPNPGLASSYTDTFRIDETAPQITGATLPDGTVLPLPNSPPPNVYPLNSLTGLTLNVVDNVNQAYQSLVTPTSVIFDALNPITAENISNYSLINTSQNDADESAYILTATFVTENPTPNATDTYILAYNGQINLTFAPGLPAGQYQFVVHTTELQYPGITDAAGNPLDDTVNPPMLSTKDFILNFDVSPQPVYITSMALESTYASNGSTVIGTEGSYFELPSTTTGTNTRDNVSAPPTAAVIDFSSPLPYLPNNGYSSDIQLIGSANGPGQPSDGDFGNLGEGGMGSTGSNYFTIMSGTQVTLYSYDESTKTWAATAPGGSGTRLVMTFGQLPADDYRIYIPNQVEPGNIDTTIHDIYGNQLDGENLGNQTSQVSDDFNNPDAIATVPLYQDLQSDGTYRPDDMSGDGVAGGAFMAGFTVVNYGNVVFAQPGYVENPLNPSTYSNGSLANPYPVLAPEADPNTLNSSHLPNGGANSPTSGLRGISTRLTISAATASSSNPPCTRPSNCRTRSRTTTSSVSSNSAALSWWWPCPEFLSAIPLPETLRKLRLCCKLRPAATAA